MKPVGPARNRAGPRKRDDGNPSHRPQSPPMRRGVTLMELLLVLVIVGLLAGVVVPGAGARADRLAVEHQAARLLTAYRAAWLTAIDSTPETIGATRRERPGPAAADVALQSPPHTTVFAPNGIAMGLANARHVLARGRAVRQVVVSRLGRVRILP
ncbi:MAG: hypothetical protein DMD43_03890 [Gemmatimonadetes bacterium]|nr:MAG: hypothetical protein DMD43_03890 [Gemmatimonadota bacterium]